MTAAPTGSDIRYRRWSPSSLNDLDVISLSGFSSALVPAFDFLANYPAPRTRSAAKWRRHGVVTGATTANGFKLEVNAMYVVFTLGTLIRAQLVAFTDCTLSFDAVAGGAPIYVPIRLSQKRTWF